MTETTPDLTDPHVILDRMKQIVENDMVIRATYVEAAISRPDLAVAGAICGGHRACAIGALWMAGGWAPDSDGYSFANSSGDSSGVFSETYRDEYLADKPALRGAHDALNAAAEAYATEQDLEVGSAYVSRIEALFEEGFRNGEHIDPRELLAVIDIAHGILRAT